MEKKYAYIDFSTLREYFFQAVSNYSWANELDKYIKAKKYADNKTASLMVYR